MAAFTCILLVDDDPISVYISTSLIENLHITEKLVAAASAQEALAILLGQNGQKPCLPDLILLDVNMPVRTGFDFLEDFNALNLSPRPVVYMLSSSQNPKDKLHAAALQANGFIAKPLSEESLLKLADELKNP